ncbi:MAG: HAD-IIIA family hydrolase [Ruminococcaceae bacterium]|nr:HAD-IIIA family hydrolase [Oscillospiraceae bacterium]
MDNRKIRLLIFDLDGTLADTMYGILDGVNMAMEKFGAPAHTYDEVRSYVGNGSRDLIKRALPKYMAENAELLEKAIKFYDGSCYPVTYKNRTDCYDGIIDALKELKERGYTLAVLSNKRDIFVRPMVSEMIPEGIISMAMGQRDDLPKKPDPAMAIYIAEKLGFEACETAFVGDSETDILTGQNAKMLTVGCSWGYRGEKILKEAGADVIIDGPSQLTELFRAF